jgi:hypothetical protein
MTRGCNTVEAELMGGKAGEFGQMLAAHPRLWFVAGILGLWFLIVTGRVTFDGWGGFIEALRYGFQPGWLSFLRGEFVEEQLAHLKIFLWLAINAMVVVALKYSATWLVIHYV